MLMQKIKIKMDSFCNGSKRRAVKRFPIPLHKIKKINLIENTLNPFGHKILFRETTRKHSLEVYEMHTSVMNWEKIKIHITKLISYVNTTIF
jgi:hypothetical protein